MEDIEEREIQELFSWGVVGDYEIFLILTCRLRVRESVVKFEERDIWINQGFICKV